MLASAQDWGGGNRPGEKGKAEGFPDQQPSLDWIQVIWTKSQTCPVLIMPVTLGGLGPEPEHPRIALGPIP